MPDLFSDPLTVEHASVDRVDAAIAKLRMVVADIDHDDVARHVRKQPSRKIGDGLGWNREEDDFSGLGGVDHGNEAPRQSSNASAARLSGPLEFAIETRCPSLARRRASVLPMPPAPMIPILMFSSNCRS